MKTKTLEERLAQLNAAAQTEAPAPAPAPEEPEEKKVAQEEKEEQLQTEDQNSSLLAELDRRFTELENKLSALSESVLSVEEPEHQAPPPNNVGEEKVANEISELKQVVANLTAQIAVQGAEAEPVSTSPTLQAPREELSGLELASSALRKQLVSQGLIKD